MSQLIRAVIDTNVIFEGLTRRGGAAGYVVDAWIVGLFQAYVSDTLCYEYMDVLSRKLSPQKWLVLEPVLAHLLSKVEFSIPFYSWRPISPDTGDEHVIDCAMNASALVVTFNVRDFRLAQQELGLRVLTPSAFVALLVES